MHGTQKRLSMPKIATGIQPVSNGGQGLADLSRAQVECWLARLKVTLINKEMDSNEITQKTKVLSIVIL